MGIAAVGRNGRGYFRKLQTLDEMIARFLFTAAHALFWAATDARDIRNGKDINHGVRWALRAAIEVGAALLALPLGWGTALTTIAAAFLFSALFRFLLNTMRGRHWAYISDNNEYDWLFIATFSDYGIGHHRAGTLAYIFEAVVFATFAYLSAVL